jgi:undecaprenyl-diphosphatase
LPLSQVIWLAVIQGLTEFLPISSTAHLVIVPRLLHWRDPGLGFDIALHFGTLIAVVVYFFPTWITLIRAALGADVHISQDGAEKGRLTPLERRHERLLIAYLAVATIPAMISGLLLHSAAEGPLRTPAVIGSAMIIVGLSMWWSERSGRCERSLLGIGFGDAFSIGVAQAFAVIPGVSRSGSTISTGLFRHMKRDAATRFSFLLSTPIIAGAALVEGRELLTTGLPPDMRFPFLLGVLVSAAVGYIAIWGLIRYLRTRSLFVFVVYRIVVGSFILVVGITNPG